MALRKEILEYIDSYLNVAEFDDYCINGLQVEGKEEITTIVTGVSASARLFEQATKLGADMIIVHHGLFWKNDPSPFSVIGIERTRLALLIKNDINLAGYHLPLDAHPDIGNNALLIKKLGLQTINAVDVGFLAQSPTPVVFNQFVQQLNNSLNTNSLSFPFGSSEVSKLLIISGSAAFDYPIAVEYGADTFITGEIKESLVRKIEEEKLNLIIAGHYNTETLGIQALGCLLENKFDVQCTFIDISNPV